jgi:hypothetical protein
LLVTYVTPDLFWLRRAPLLVQAGLRAIGEPFHSTLSADQMRALLEAAGLRVEQDTDTRDWARELAPHAKRAPLLAYERLAVAVKDS